MARAATAEPAPEWSFGKIRWGRFVFWLIAGGIGDLARLAVELQK